MRAVVRRRQDRRMAERSPTLSEPGFWLMDGVYGTYEEAFAAAEEFVGSRLSVERTGPPSVIGDFIIPPLEGSASRDFQTLHFDFGLPLDPKVARDVARYTALYIAPGDGDVTAVTRLVPLAPLLSQREWPERPGLIARFVAYGRTHGARDDRTGYSEGSFARVIDAAGTSRPLLVSVKTEPEFLCGTEFDTLGAEDAFFRRHGLDVEEVEIDLVLRPGQLLVFDNLALAHGRRGRRRPGELHQRIFGHRQLSPAGQQGIRERVLSAFTSRPHDSPPASSVSLP